MGVQNVYQASVMRFRRECRRRERNGPWVASLSAPEKLITAWASDALGRNLCHRWVPQRGAPSPLDMVERYDPTNRPVGPTWAFAGPTVPTSGVRVRPRTRKVEYTPLAGSGAGQNALALGRGVTIPPRNSWDPSLGYAAWREMIVALAIDSFRPVFYAIGGALGLEPPAALSSVMTPQVGAWDICGLTQLRKNGRGTAVADCKRFRLRDWWLETQATPAPSERFDPITEVWEDFASIDQCPC